MGLNNMAWGLAIISIVVVSWIFYRFIAPKSWRDWAAAGIVKAFIIAFYAEMYGFPVTIYLLTRWFKFDVTGSFWEDNLWVQLFGTEWAMIIAMMIGYFFVFIGLILLISGWREIYHARQEKSLVTTGIYRLMRHPQYTGIFIAIFGEGVVHWPTIFSLTAFPIIVVMYSLLAKKEERDMLKKFGEQYRKYQQRVPMFIPHMQDLANYF